MKENKLILTNEKIELFISFKHSNVFYVIRNSHQKDKIFYRASTGIFGFKNSKKKSPHSGIICTNEVINKLKTFKVKNVSLVFRGINRIRDSVINTLLKNPVLEIASFEDITRIRFGGCRPQKAQRK